jgi:serine/threonine protein kinase
VLEIVGGGEMFDRMLALDRFSERDAAHAARGLLTALAYLHGRGIVHRDIKPQNILYADEAMDAEIKLVDFGLAREIPLDGAPMLTMCGTSRFVCPEIVTAGQTGGYTSAGKVDTWSAGAILFLLLSGDVPFEGVDDLAIFRKVRKGAYTMAADEWAGVSQPARQLVEALLVVDPARRLSAEEARARHARHNHMQRAV